MKPRWKQNLWGVALLVVLAMTFYKSCATRSTQPSPSARPELVLQTGHSSEVYALAFSTDGRTLASGSWDNTVKLWNAQTGRLRHTLTGHSSGVKSVAFSPDGKRVISGSDDGTVKLWDTRSGRLLVTLMILPPSKKEEVSTDWFVFTPEGYYDGSEGAKRSIKWRDGNDLLPAERYERDFHRPDLVQKALRGER